ncbi:hypothetical protein [Streptomyces sp. AC558_RSS880]|uniref:hypothetical protein n=1 Tax=Streptomyces sp. AC558_RSS880 TaxID=2823687 RepID=UPI0027E55D68|nr:hypothetical protein [Streptomyces sp. AC558_RSS880]
MLSGLGLSAVCAAGALIAAVGIVAMAFHGRPRPRAAHLLRRAAGTAAAVHSPGFLSVLMSEQAFGDGADSIPAPACRDGFDAETEQGLSHHRSSYLPLRFDRARHDGTVCSGDPGHVRMNGATLSLALAAALLVIGAGHASEFRARKKTAVMS